MTTPTTSTTTNVTEEDDIFRSPLPILKANEYDSWEYLLQTILEAKSLEGTLEVDSLEGCNEELKLKAKKTKAIIARSLPFEFLEYVHNAVTPKGMLNNLRTTLVPRIVGAVMHNCHQLFTIKLAESEGMQKHLIKFDGIFQQLSILGEKMSVTEKAVYIFESLLKSYKATIESLRNTNIDQLTMEFVKGRLIDSHQQQQRHSSSNGNANGTNSNDQTQKSQNGENSQETVPMTALMVTRNKSRIKKGSRCYRCRKPGHYANECREKNDRRSRGNGYSRSYWNHDYSNTESEGSCNSYNGRRRRRSLRDRDRSQAFMVDRGSKEILFAGEFIA